MGIMGVLLIGSGLWIGVSALTALVESNGSFGRSLWFLGMLGGIAVCGFGAQFALDAVR